MGNNILQYSNGWGHLIMSVFFTLVGLFLIVFPGLDVGTRGIGIGLIATVSAAWFIPGAAKQVATNVVQQVQETTTPNQPTMDNPHHA